MTTYVYNIQLRDSEVIMLKQALKNMITHCEEQLALGKRAPYLAHKMSAQRVLEKIYDNIIQTSGNTFK